MDIFQWDRCVSHSSFSICNKDSREQHFYLQVARQLRNDSASDCRCPLEKKTEH